MMELTDFDKSLLNLLQGSLPVCSRPFAKLAEGVYTVEALMDLAREYRVELPICETVYEIVHNHQDPKDQLTQLFMRSTKSELA